MLLKEPARKSLVAVMGKGKLRTPDENRIGCVARLLALDDIVDMADSLQNVARFHAALNAAEVLA